MQVIIIDDSRAMRGILKRIAADLGLSYSEALDGQQAIQVLQAMPTPPALALVDWNMPNMNGLEFVKHIRQDHRYDDMCVVMVTTEVEMERMALALEAGANDYIMKPFTGEIIRERLQRLGFAAASEVEAA